MGRTAEDYDTALVQRQISTAREQTLRSTTAPDYSEAFEPTSVGGQYQRFQQRSGRQPVVARTVLDTSVLAEAMRATRT